MSFQIGDIKIENKVVLAPMAGVSNSPFRIFSRRFGAGLVFSEMVSDKGLLFNNEKTIRLLHMTDLEKPMVQQIFGSDVKTMVEAAKYVDQHSNCDIIDINMGCPVPKVAIKAQAGSSLMKDPVKVYEIVKAVRENVTKPVSVKIRSGWDFNTINAVEVAKKIEEAGAQAITVHARTRSQGYTGKADWSIIKAVKEAVSIPVIGNGDIIDGPSAKKMLDETGCDAVMIGRAALGNPWIFREINHYLETNENYKKPDMIEIKDMMIQHLNALIELKGEKTAILEMRSHGPWYLKGIPHASSLKKKLSQIKHKKEFINLLNEFFDSHIRTIEIIDHHDYQPTDKIFKRRAVRGIIYQQNKLVMIRSDLYGEYKFPGGGQEEDETDIETLRREVLEETGLDLIEDSVIAYGKSFERRKSVFEKDTLFDMTSIYYLCDTKETTNLTKLDTYEKNYGYKKVLVDLYEAIEKNQDLLNKYSKDIIKQKIPWIERELLVLKDILKNSQK